MISINGVPAKQCERPQLLRALEKVTKQRDDYRNANLVINETLGQQYAEIQILRSELRIIKKEIEKINIIRTTL